MENRSHAIAAGLFVLSLAAALVWGALWFNRDPITNRVPIIITTTNSVTGLKVDAPVRFRGVEVGKVDAIRFDKADPGRISIWISVADDAPLSKSTYAQLGLQGVTGLSYVQLNDDGISREPLATSADNVAKILLRPSLVDSGEDIVASVGEAVERFNALLSEENQQAVTKTLAGLERAVQRATTLAESVQPAVQRMPALLDDARGAVKRADGLIANLDTLTKKLDERVALLNEIEAGAIEVRTTARSVSDDTIPRLNALADELRRETRVLDRLLNSLNDAPQSVVFGQSPRPPGPGEPGFVPGGR